MLVASLFIFLGTFFTDISFNFFGLRSPGFAVVVGGMGTLFFGYAFFFMLKRFLFPKGALVITPVGIINRTNALGSRHIIAFEEMKKAKLERVNSSSNIGISLYDEEKYLKNLPWLKRKASEINQRYFNTSIISLDVPPISKERLNELIDIINERIENAQQP